MIDPKSVGLQSMTGEHVVAQTGVGSEPQRVAHSEVVVVWHSFDSSWSFPGPSPGSPGPPGTPPPGPPMRGGITTGGTPPGRHPMQGTQNKHGPPQNR